MDVQYGIPTEERVFIGLHQKRLGLAAEVDEPFAFARRARMRAALVDYQHIEYAEDKSPGTTFTNKGFEARGELPLVPLARWSTVLGVQGFSHELAAVGEESVIPRPRPAIHAWRRPVLRDRRRARLSTFRGGRVGPYFRRLHERSLEPRRR
jgi:iron complex outermembrane recepter protein